MLAIWTSPRYRSLVLERDIQKACLDYLTLRGIFCWRQNQGAIPDGQGGFRRFNGVPGQSDIIGVLPDGRFLAVEVKQPGKKPTETQQAFIDRIAQNGGVGTWVCDVDELARDLDEALSQKKADSASSQAA